MRNRITQQRATALRNKATDSEQKLWRYLRRRQIRGLRFRRQVPIGPYIADFACLEIALIIEVDGGQHLESERDVVRERYLRAQGFCILRFWNNQVLSETEAVLQMIFEATGMPPP